MPLPWREVNSCDPRDVAEKLGISKARGQKDKWECKGCGSSDALHTYDHQFFCFSACGRAYTNVDMAMVAFDLNAVDACKELASLLGIKYDEDDADGTRARVPNFQHRERRKTAQEQNWHDLKATSKPFYPHDIYQAIHDLLTSLPEGAGYGLSKDARSYLEGRNFDSDQLYKYGYRSIETAGVWTRILNEVLTEKRFSELELRTAGFPKEEGRIILPWGGKLKLLVIPYRRTEEGNERFISLRFRNMEAPTKKEKGKKATAPKYLSLRDASPPWPYNADDIEKPHIHIIEGELNAEALRKPQYQRILTSAHGIIGIAGAWMWDDKWTNILLNAESIITWYHDDPAGDKGHTRIQENLEKGAQEKLGLNDAEAKEFIAKKLQRVKAPKDTNDLDIDNELESLLRTSPWNL
jgi:hypothetical protein